MPATEFLNGISGKLAERWFTNTLAPASIFWGGGLVLFIQKFGWKKKDIFAGLTIQDILIQTSEARQIALLVTIFLLLVISSFVIRQFEFGVLRFLEGYWPRCLRPLRRQLVKRQMKRLQHADRKWQKLAQIEVNTLTADQREDLVQLDWQLMHNPADPDQLMPTRLGNILRSSELRPREKYGLDAVICWSRFWLVLPEATQNELGSTRANLNTAVRVWLWSMLFPLWGILCPLWDFRFSLWAIPVGLAVAGFTYYGWMLSAAALYADLLESAFDLHRTALYQSLRWPLPQNPAEERQAGEQLTAYLWRGSDRPHPQFTVPE